MRIPSLIIPRNGFALHVIDPSTASSVIDTIDPLMTTLDATRDSFLNTFTGKVVGALIGNILAGVVIKYISDLVFSAMEKKPSADSSFAPSTPKLAPPPKDISGEAWLQLLFCLALDFGGDLSFTLPGVGEVEDLAWAPLSAFLLKAIFGSNSLATIDFVKEILPGTDIIPVASLAWLLQNYYPESFLTKSLGLAIKEKTKE